MRTTIPLLAALLAASAIPGTAQQARYARGERAWLGVSYDVQWLQKGEQCEPRVRVERVINGSPAERAGLRTGDLIVALNGQPVPAARLQELAGRLSPGDSIRLRFSRDGRVREVTAVADRRPDRPIVEAAPVPGGLDASSAPIVFLEGDTLLARNVEGLLEGARGYWLASDDGRARYRRLASWSDDDLDARVLSLLRCAETVQWDPVPPTPRFDVARVRERADSLRTVIARRALTSGNVRVEVRSEPTGEARRWVVRGSDDPDERVFGSGTYVMRFEDHVAVGMRGVAGAELTALEPELADYFRGARTGLLVLRIAPGTPADRAGLRPGDVLVEAGARRLDSVDELRSLLARPGSGDLELKVVRKGRTREIILRRR